MVYRLGSSHDDAEVALAAKADQDSMWNTACVEERPAVMCSVSLMGRKGYKTVDKLVLLCK